MQKNNLRFMAQIFFFHHKTKLSIWTQIYTEWYIYTEYDNYI